MSRSSSVVVVKEDCKPQFKTLPKEDQLDLENHMKALKNIREALSEDLLTNLKKVDPTCEELKRAISLNIGDTSLHYFKDVIKSINEMLDRNDNSLNRRQKEFSEKEKLLREDLTQIEQRVFDASAGKTHLNSRRPLQYKPLETYHVDLPLSICVFDDFLLKSGGHSGGWKAEDHQLFLHLKTKYSVNQLADIIHEKMPDISPAMVLEHSAWYDQYVRLLQDKKDAINKWKESRKSHRSFSVGSLQQTEEEKAKSSTRRQPGTEEEMKSQIAQWKIERAAKTKEENEKRKLAEEKKRNLERKKRENQALEREKLLRLKEAKAQLEWEETQKQDKLKYQEQLNKARKANIMIQVFRKQDERKLHDKLERKKEFVNRELENIERLRRVKSSVDVKRDPKRVEQATSVWKHKVANESEESYALSPDQNINYISYVSRLKVPEWRQDVKYEDQIVL